MAYFTAPSAPGKKVLLYWSRTLAVTPAQPATTRSSLRQTWPLPRPPGWTLTLARVASHRRSSNRSPSSGRGGRLVTFFVLLLCRPDSSMTRLGDLLHFGQLFKAWGNNYFTQITHILGNFGKGGKIFHFSAEIIYWAKNMIRASVLRKAHKWEHWIIYSFLLVCQARRSFICLPFPSSYILVISTT